MNNLISQIEQAAGGSVVAEIQLLKQHRKSLDDVIKLTLGISSLQHSLESVLLLKKPTKDIPRDLLSILGNISDSVANLPSDELCKRLVRIEESIQDDIDTIMGISNQLENLDPAKPQEAGSGIAADDLHTLVDDFRRRTNTAIILKLHLRKRGVVVSETTIPVSTDVLVAQVSKLVFEEKKCRIRSIQELGKLLQQTTNIINNDNYPENMKEYAKQMQLQVNQNIEHLKQGKDIEKMPFVIEIIEMGTESKDRQTKKENSKKRKSKDTKRKETVKNKKAKSGFIKKLFKWLSSPWSVNWKDIE